MEEKKKKNHGVRLSWWLVVLAVVVFGSIYFLISSGIDKNAAPIKTKPDTANEIKIKQNISSMRGDIVRYFESNKTYEGWKLDPTVEKLVNDAGSDLKTKLGKDLYMIYAKMPSSKLTFCIDNAGGNGFTGELERIGSKTCK